ncbi:MAG: FHIPEP family type III secretion protein [Planctomycetales bacterium]|nr:FHIPEP family type III secretion protein [Planctomycetales bacterium]
MTELTAPSIDSNVGFFRRSETLLSAALLGILVVLLVPLPPLLLDLLLTVNLGVTVLLLLVVLGVKHPLEISVFPSLLLLMTLYRLSLNVATTRLVLIDGDAGRLVSAFGGFVVGGNLVVGLVIFVILVVVQFIVITRGAGRVSEVAARFTLDAMPGKQMAIDAELGAGAIDEKTARHRRAQLSREAEFYGAMDGASKFVRGDAIAGLVVTAVNLIGGMILGVGGGLSVAEAATRYSILTIGDGLVSQIPALVIATASGILVTKTASEVSLSKEIESQMLLKHGPLLIGGSILGLLALAPGMPKFPFLMIAVVFVVAARRMKTREANVEAKEDEQPAAPVNAEEELFDRFLETDRACLEIGTRLIPYVESRRSKGLMDRIPGLRQELTRKHGIWVPPVRIRDNLKLRPDEYRILIGGRDVARGIVHPEHFLAIAPQNPTVQIEGDATTDPTFGLPAVWIEASNKQRAEIVGYTVVDSVGVVITHLSEVLRKFSHELLTREDVQRLLERVKETSPTLVEEMKPDRLPLNTLHQVLQLLLEERIPITDLSLILEACLNYCMRTKVPGELAELIRPDIGRNICDRFRGESGHVQVVIVHPHLGMQLMKLVRDGELKMSFEGLETLVKAITKQVQVAASRGADVAVLADVALRRPLRHAIRRSLPDVSVVAYTDIPNELNMEPYGQIGLTDVPLGGEPYAGGAGSDGN